MGLREDVAMGLGFVEVKMEVAKGQYGMLAFRFLKPVVWVFQEFAEKLRSMARCTSPCLSKCRWFKVQHDWLFVKDVDLTSLARVAQAVAPAGASGGRCFGPCVNPRSSTQLPGINPTNRLVCWQVPRSPPWIRTQQ